MPELPEVETTRKGIAPYVVGEVIKDIIIRERNLRWPIPANLKRLLKNQLVRKLRRRAKYLLFYTDKGCLILHLGMSGSVRIIDSDEPAGKHDHVDLRLESGKSLRFRDPRRDARATGSRNQPPRHRAVARKPAD